MNKGGRSFIQHGDFASKVFFHLCSKRIAELDETREGVKYVNDFSLISKDCSRTLIISAWNYPFLLAIDPVIGAIAAGNTVVLKPSEIAPATSAFFARVLPNYVDSSCIKVGEGSVPETTALLEQKWDKILYTGNAKVGRIIMAAAAKHLTPVVLELGGKCPAVVDSTVDLKVASKRVVLGKWGSNNGQACVAPDYIITTKSFAPQLFMNPSLPFGGVGESGIGAYHGKFSFDAFSHKKAVLHRSLGWETSARFPAFTPQKQKLLRAILTANIIGVILAVIGFPRS